LLTVVVASLFLVLNLIAFLPMFLLWGALVIRGDRGEPQRRLLST
jgi:hypothetical protein